MGSPTAVVTGATRGIGRATAIGLARLGYDVAVCGRTLREGDASLPGSLESVAAAIEAEGQRAVPVVLDLLDTATLGSGAQAAIDGLGHVDVVLNNAIYDGPHDLARFLDTPPTELERRVCGNLTGHLIFTQPLLRHMQARESGTIAFTTSGAAFAPVRAAPGEGGWWSLAYAVSKAGLHRVAEQLRVEHRSLRFLNLDPGAVATEKVLAGATGEFDFVAKAAAPVDAVGDACARILASPKKLFRNGSTVDVQATARLWGLLPV